MSKDWRDDVVAQFHRDVAPITVVYDPDGLMGEEVLLERLRIEGFDVVFFDDSIQFRFDYEQRYRSRWDAGDETKELILIVRCMEHGDVVPPWDVLKLARTVSISVGQLFPRLWAPTLAGLDPATIDELYAIYTEEEPRELGDQETRDYVLQNVFDLNVAVVRSDHQLLALLLTIHYDQRRLAECLVARVEGVLKRRPFSSRWELSCLLRDRGRFLSFISKRWRRFVQQHEEQDFAGVAEEEEGYGDLGPFDLPFEHPRVRTLLDNYFADGLIPRVRYRGEKPLEGTWIGAGLEFSEDKEHRVRMGTLLSEIRKAMPTEDARYQEWLSFATKWGTLLHHAHSSQQGIQEIENIRKKLDQVFTDWLIARYDSLVLLPGVVMVHRVPHQMARNVGSAKQALIVVDGLSVENWILLRDDLVDELPDVAMDQGNAFGWIPSLTSISRQSIFAGERPSAFAESLATTGREPGRWKRFWEDHGIAKDDVHYRSGITNAEFLKQAISDIDAAEPRVVGLVIDTIDKIVHGMVLGDVALHGQVRQWSKEGLLLQALKELLERDYQITITSDHGHVSATGCGTIAEGVLPEIKGSRARIYTERAFLDQAMKKVPEALHWTPRGLPEGLECVFPPQGQAFVKRGDLAISHGGLTLEEVVVPYITMSGTRS